MKKRRTKYKFKYGSKRFKKLVHPSLDQELLARIRAQSMLYVDDGEDNELEEVRATDPYIELAAMMIQAASKRGVYLLLSWPIGFEWVGLSHALACRTLSTHSHGQMGLRMSLYPALYSNYGRYRRTRFPMESFLNEARNAANRISKSLSPRHLAYMHLNQLEKDDDPRKHPALLNAISLFELDTNNSIWSPYGKGYFSDVCIALHHHTGRTKQQKEQVAEYAAIMADSAQATEAVFRIKRNIKLFTAREILINGDQKYNFIVIDARQKLIEGIVSWRNVLGELIEQVAKKETAPSLLLITDNPAMYNFFSFKLQKLKQNKKRTLSKKIYNNCWLRNTESLWQQTRFDNNSFTPWFNIKAKVTDAQTLFEINKINKMAIAIKKSNPELAHELRCSGGFLRRLVNMPVGQKVVEQWLLKVTESWSETRAEQLASRYSWRHYRLQMYRRVKDSSANDPIKLDRCMNIATSLVNRITDSTSIERETIKIVNKCVEKSKCTMIIVENKKYIEWLEVSLKYHVGESVMDYVTIAADFKPKKVKSFNTLLFAGVERRQLASLLFTNQLPDSTVLILDAYSAQAVQYDLAILKDIEEFSIIHPRVDKLFKLIEPQIKSFKLVGSIFELPTEMPDNWRHHVHEYDLSEPYAMIHLSGFGVLSVGEFSSLIKVNHNKQPPFQAVSLHDLTEGDRLLYLGDEQRDKISEILKVQGGRLTNDAEKLLMVYFEIANNFINVNYNQHHRTQRARSLLKKMKNINPETVKGVNEDMVVRWIKHIEEFDLEVCSINSNELKTNSPRSKTHFMLFAEALGFDPTSSQQYWYRGIYQLRIGRILEGRKLGNRIKNILTGAIEFTDLHMEPDDLNNLFTIAHECTFPIEFIISKEDFNEESFECSIE